MVLGLVLLLMNYKLEGAIFIGIGGIMFLLTLPLFILIIISFRPAGAKRAVHLFIAAVARLSRNHLNLSKFQG